MDLTEGFCGNMEEYSQQRGGRADGAETLRILEKAGKGNPHWKEVSFLEILGGTRRGGSLSGVPKVGKGNKPE